MLAPVPSKSPGNEIQSRRAGNQVNREMSAARLSGIKSSAKSHLQFFADQLKKDNRSKQADVPQYHSRLCKISDLEVISVRLTSL